MYEEKYLHLPMKNSIEEKEIYVEIKYEWLFKTQTNFIKVIAERNSLPALAGSEEEFITEHYWGYTKLKNGNTSEYEVVHPKWNIHKAKVVECACNFENLYGNQFGEYLTTPKSVFLADGSPVAVQNKTLLTFSS